MEYYHEDFTIISLIPINFMSKKTIIKLIEIAINHYDKVQLKGDNINWLLYKKKKKKKLINELYQLYEIKIENDNSYIKKFK